MATQLDERRLRTVVYRIARLYLEVERGLRPPDHLKRILGRKEYGRHRREPMETRHHGAGPVIPDDIRGIRIDRNTNGHITASVTAREKGDRWGAITMHLKERREGWVVDHLDRIHRRGLEAEQNPTTVEPLDFDRRAAYVAEELRLVTSARRSAEQRLDDLTASTVADATTMRPLRNQLALWTERQAGLEDELTQLRERADIHRRLGSPSLPHPSVEPGDPSPDPVADRLSRVLGPPPRDPDAKAIWDAAYGHVSEYRNLWHVEDNVTLLGDLPQYEGQQRHRQEVIEHLKEAALMIPPPDLAPEAGFRRDGIDGPELSIEL